MAIKPRKMDGSERDDSMRNGANPMGRSDKPGMTQADFADLMAALPGDHNHPDAIRQRLEAMELLLERSLAIPGTKIRFGLDSLIGLVPVVGDVITGILGCYMIWEARNLGLSKFQITRMAANVGIDSVLGSIPLAGDVFDFVWRSNTKNLRILKKHLDKHHPASQIIEG